MNDFLERLYAFYEEYEASVTAIFVMSLLCLLVFGLNFVLMAGALASGALIALGFYRNR